MSDWIKKIEPRYGYYIAGFVDGEGSFNVSIVDRPDYQTGVKILLSFNISQKDRVILAFIKKVMQCGHLRERSDGVVYYEVNNVHAIIENVIPFFERFGFMSAKKKKNFSLFKKIVYLVQSGKHLNEEGLQEIFSVRELLNEGKGLKRKYEFKEKKLINNKNGKILRDYTQDTPSASNADRA